MILTAANVGHYLLSRGLLTFESVIDGDPVVLDASRRNRNFKIIRREHPSLFLKQAFSRDIDRFSAIEREATCYRLAQTDARFAVLASLMPPLLHYDAENLVLVFELLPPESETLREYHERLGQFAPQVGAQLGASLGAYHSITTVVEDAVLSASVFPKRLPWILSFHSQPLPGRSYPNVSISQLQSTLRQFPAFTDRLDQLRSEWQFDCLMHGDMRLDNCLLYTDPGDGDRLQVKIVDWELADFGDAGWDLGGVLQSYLSSWVFSMPDTGTTPAIELVERAGYRLDQMQPAMRAFWGAYSVQRCLTSRESRNLLKRSIRLGAARLIQTAYEALATAPQLDASAVRLLQLSYNILESPCAAVDYLVAS